jgi:spore coat polysaccharide biosynthesis protein SpsF
MLIGVVVQARMSSVRYPGKVLQMVNGKPLLKYLLESLYRCESVNRLVVATSNKKSDDPVEELCRNIGVDYYRGSLDNVAQRFLEAINVYKFDAFIRLSGDSPLLDYRLVDRAVRIFQSAHFDLVTNTLKRTFPKGQSVEVLDSTIFITTYAKMLAFDEREHVTRYFYTHNEEFAIYNFVSEKAYGNLELSVNTPEDMRRFKAIINSMEKPHWEYNFEELIELSSAQFHTF